MPVNKNAMTRYKILDELLSSRYHNYSLDDLTEEVSKRMSEMYPDFDGVGRRTIEKDIYYLEYEGPFMVDIERYSVSCYSAEKQKTFSKRCLRYTSPSFSIFKKEMTDDEKCLLREALSLLGQFDGLPNLDRLEGMRLELGVHTTEEHIISFTKNPLENSNLLGELFTCISQKQVVELHYHVFSKPDESMQINLHPYLLKEYNRRWYLFGEAEGGSKLLNFSLDRIDKCIPLPSHAYKDYDGIIDEQFDDIIGVTLLDNSPVYKIVFWVSDRSKDYVMTKPLHDSQRTLPEETIRILKDRYPFLEGGIFLRIDCKRNYELIRELTSFGKELLVLEPGDIKNEVIEHVSSMMCQYDKLRTYNS